MTSLHEMTAYAQQGDREDDFDGEPHDECPECYGEGLVHDCGEDTCCCADPTEQDMVMCPECDGWGYL